MSRAGLRKSAGPRRPGIEEVKRKLATLDRTAAARVAEMSAPHLTRDLQAAWDSGRTVYGTARPRSVVGAPLDLYDTGETRGDARFTPLGAQVRVYFKESHARFLIGKYSILPSGNQALPSPWIARFREALATIGEHL